MNAPAALSTSRRRLPLTFWMGLLLLAGAQSLLFFDVASTGRGAVHDAVIIQSYHRAPVNGALGAAARFVAINMTPLAWTGYLLLLEGLLARQPQGSPIRRRPHHFALLLPASICIWCLFDVINFVLGMRAWHYIGMPDSFYARFRGYLIAFGAIVPGMLLSGQLLLNAGWFDWARSPRWRLPGWGRWAFFLVGLAMFIWPLVHRDPVTNLTLWTSLVFLLDPINLMLGRPSMLRDWQNGWYGRTLAAFAGGLLCGFLWEFWNYWALTKWIYDLPFLGSAEHFRYFEMPVIGLLGFIPFGIECWVIWQSMRVPLDGLAEPLPDEKTLL